MHYDPIMCMVVEDKVKTKDADNAKLEELYNAAKAFERGLNELKKRGSSSGYIEAMERKYEEAKKKYKSAGGTKAFDSNTIDKAIRVMDVNKNEGFKIHKAEIRGDKLYITYTDLLYGEKGTESFTKNEAKGFLKDPWNTWEGNTKSVMLKFVNG